MNTSPLPSDPFEPGSEHVAVPHDLAVSGGGIARISGMTVFLDAGLPDEKVLCRITERKPRFARAEVIEVLEPSPHAVPSFCAHGGICGGCAWTTLAYAAQTAWKERQVRETLRRIGKVAFSGESGAEAGAEYLPLIPSPRALGYRNKMEYAFGFDEGAPVLGLRARGSHAVVSIEECALAAVPVKPVLNLVRQWMRASSLEPWDGASGFLRFLVVRCPDHMIDGRQQCLVELITAPGDAAQASAVKALGETLLAGEAGVTGFVHSTRRDRANVAYGDTVVATFGRSTVIEMIGQTRIEAPVQSFLQANTGAAALLYAQIKAYADATAAGTVWDVYCGAGGIALFLAAQGRCVRGVDSVAEAVAFAEKNAAEAPGDVAFVRGDAARVMADPRPVPDLVVTDPPRAGMAADLLASLKRLEAEHMICVSCDAASLARDIAGLAGRYQVLSARAVDVFPNTPHVEVAALLKRCRR